VSNGHSRPGDDQPSRRRPLRLVGDRPGAAAAARSMRVSRATAEGTSPFETPTEAGGVWLQILGVIRELQLTIAAHEEERAAFEAWATAERAAIARERAALERERAQRSPKHRRRRHTGSTKR
jgi:hypothetical protein